MARVDEAPDDVSISHISSVAERTVNDLSVNAEESLVNKSLTVSDIASATGSLGRGPMIVALAISSTETVPDAAFVVLMMADVGSSPAKLTSDPSIETFTSRKALDPTKATSACLYPRNVICDSITEMLTEFTVVVAPTIDENNVAIAVVGVLPVVVVTFTAELRTSNVAPFILYA
jgi:hypothetical protein